MVSNDTFCASPFLSKNGEILRYEPGDHDWFPPGWNLVFLST